MAEYFCSDLHGEYDIFMRLLEKCKISGADTVYVLGDIIDKGKNAFRLLDFIRKNSVFKPICGNHEYALLQIYQNSMTEYDGKNDDIILRKIRDFYPIGGESITWDMVDYLDSLPYYLEKPQFICVHAGLKLNADNTIIPLKTQRINDLVFDRRFKENCVVPDSGKTVLFGHTPCSYDNGTGKFIMTPKKGVIKPEKLTDYSKIRLDTGISLTGMAGMLRADDMREIYIEALR